MWVSPLFRSHRLPSLPIPNQRGRGKMNQMMAQHFNTTHPDTPQYTSSCHSPHPAAHTPGPTPHRPHPRAHTAPPTPRLTACSPDYAPHNWHRAPHTTPPTPHSPPLPHHMTHAT